ncbi:hypothetical protein [Parahaliea mediterranea]|uniref:Uncharacterized protein n=1 Tax=Parahaliea mediterranea TaxID=651086 RepID=A0A939DEC9_9GAMM|nr:hypothetical protein [Parahaliea mediterranea]MBN7795942.1 hypothetical protein [Parahaliea mediterranea]
MSNLKNTSTQALTVTIPSDHTLEMGAIREGKNYPAPPYGMLGRSGRSKHKIDGVNVPFLLKQLTGTGHWFFWTLVEARDYETNLVKPTQLAGLSRQERGRIARAYKELEKKRLAIRTARQTYLINPKVMLPMLKYFERTWFEWEAACNKKGLTTEASVPFALKVTPGNSPPAKLA